MKSRLALSLALAVGCGAGLIPHATFAAGPSYHIVKRIKPGGEGGWDYLTMDSADRRLFVSRSSHVQVIDVDRDTLIADIPNTPGVHGIALAPDLGRGFTSNGRDSSVTVFDLKTLSTLAVIHIPARNPDAIAYDPATHRIFTFNGGSGTATAIEGASGNVAGTVTLGGRPEFAASDGHGHMYVNLEDSSAVVRFDSKSLTIDGRWPLAPGEGPSGLALDRDGHRLFSGCSNKLVVVLDSRTGHKVGQVPIGQGVDAVAFDAELKRALSSNGEGTLTVIAENAPDSISVVDNVTTQRGARTLALDERTHRVYLATAEFGPPPDPTPERPHPRPPMIPGSFVILVLER